MRNPLHRFRRRRQHQGRPSEELPEVQPGQGSQGRLSANHRIPINIWGDVMTDGSPPQIRRVITGQDAHESLLVYYYLAEILTLQEIAGALPDLEPAIRSTPSILDRFSLAQTATRDPHNHLQPEILQVFLPAVLFLDSAGSRGMELCELGCSFFSAIDKVRICSALLGSKLATEDVRWAAIDHSDFFLRGAVAFHPHERVERFTDYTDWRPDSQHPLHVSRFVASYATNSTLEFADWMEEFAAFHIIDVINLEESDFVTSNNGLRQNFFDLPALVKECAAKGWTLYLNEATPDFNSGQRCAVVKIFGIRKDLEREYKIAEQIASRRDLQELLPMEPLSHVSATELLGSLHSALTRAEWTALAEYKRHFPIWGKPLEPMETLADVHRLIRPPDGDLDLVFESGQVNYYVRHALNED